MVKNLSIRLRPAEPAADFPRIAELLSHEGPPVTAAMLHEWENRRFEGQIRRRMVAVTRD